MYLCALLTQGNRKWYTVRLGFNSCSGYICGSLNCHGAFPNFLIAFQRSNVIRMTRDLAAGVRRLQSLNLLISKLFPGRQALLC